MPFYVDLLRLSRSERHIWEQLKTVFDELLARLREMPPQPEEDEVFQQRLIAVLREVGKNLEAAKFDHALLQWEPTAQDEATARELLEPGETEADIEWLRLQLMKCKNRAFRDRVRGHIARFAEELLRATEPDETASEPARPSNVPAATSNENVGMLSASDLAKRFDLDPEAVRKRLERWRTKHPEESGEGWTEVPDRSPRAPAYLYRVATVLETIEDCPTSAKTSSKRPAKKN